MRKKYFFIAGVLSAVFLLWQIGGAARGSPPLPGNGSPPPGGIPLEERGEHDWMCRVTPSDGGIVRGVSQDAIYPVGEEGFIDVQIVGSSVHFSIHDSDGIHNYGVDWKGDGGFEEHAYPGEATLVEGSFFLEGLFSGLHQVTISYRDVADSYTEASFLVPGGSGEDRDLQDFLAWMERVGFSEPIRSLYQRHLTHPVVRKLVQKDFDLHNGLIVSEELETYKRARTFRLVLHDLLPAEPDASFTPETKWRHLESAFERILGRDVTVEYIHHRIPYADYVWRVEGSRFFLDDLRLAEDQMKELMRPPTKGHLFHIAVRSLVVDGVRRDLGGDSTGSSPSHTPLLVGGGLSKTAGVYLHEWGHGFGMGHRFIGEEVEESKFFGTDDIMIHTYIRYPNSNRGNIGRLGGPLTLYVLEPEAGYAPLVITKYNKAHENSWMLTASHRPMSPLGIIRKEGNCLICDVGGSFDRNGDPITYTYLWVLDRRTPLTPVSSSIDRLCW